MSDADIAALAEYADHKEGCPGRRVWWQMRANQPARRLGRDLAPCTCGLDEKFPGLIARPTPEA